jgi:hypothetical protein
MDLPQGGTVTQDWRKYFELSKSFSGTMVVFCREQNIDYDKFMYHRVRLIKREKAANGNSSFVKVKPSSEIIQAVAGNSKSAKSDPRLPDPKWLADFIHSLVVDK